MNKISTIFFISLFLNLTRLGAAFVGIYDSSDVNKFVDLDSNRCLAGAKKDGNSPDACFPVQQPLKLIIDPRQQLGDLFGVNVLSPAFKNRIVYVYNQFGYWTNIEEDSSKAGGASKDEKSAGTFHADQASRQEVQKMKSIPQSGQGIYQIMISACPSMVRRVVGTTVCPDGQYPVVAVLSLANAQGLYPLCTSMLCLAPTDQFVIEVSTAGEPSRAVPENVLVDTLSEGPAVLVFRDDIGSSPRSITLKKK
jgi:hypothetical protein